MQKHFYLIILGLFSLKQIEACEAAKMLPEQTAVQTLEIVTCEIKDNRHLNLHVTGGVPPYKVSCNRYTNEWFIHDGIVNSEFSNNSSTYKVRVEDKVGKVVEKVVTSIFSPEPAPSYRSYGSVRGPFDY